MNVLSCFDGMSCGQLALNKLEVKIDNYFAAEIKPHAIKVTQSNFPNTIQLGDITKVNGHSLPKIDLLLAGSPCKDLSAANKTRDGLAGEKSGLFYEFVRLLKETNPTYFLLENVKMDKKWEDEISNILGVKPIIIDSALVTGAFRKRLYWTNIPQYDSIADSHVNLQELLDSGYTDRNKARCLLESDSRPSATPVKMFHRYYGKGFTTLIFKDEQHYYDCKNHYDSNYKGLAAKDIECDSNVYEGVRYLTKKERERLQTVPVGYCKDLTENEAASLLGDGWTVDVIVHLLKNIESND